MSTEGKRTDFSPLSEHDGLIERYKAKNLDGILEVSGGVTLWCWYKPDVSAGPQQDPRVEWWDSELRPQLSRPGYSGMYNKQ